MQFSGGRVVEALTRVRRCTRANLVPPPRLRASHAPDRLGRADRLRLRTKRVKGGARAATRVAAAAREQTEHDQRADRENSSHPHEATHSAGLASAASVRGANLGRQSGTLAHGMHRSCEATAATFGIRKEHATDSESEEDQRQGRGVAGERTCVAVFKRGAVMSHLQSGVSGGPALRTSKTRPVVVQPP